MHEYSESPSRTARAIRERQLEAEVERLREALDVDSIAALIFDCHLRPEGVSPRQIAQEIIDHIETVARTPRLSR